MTATDNASNSANWFRWIPVVISVVALGLSSLSMVESRRARINNESLNRPILESDQLDAVFVGNSGADAEVSFSLALSNNGKSEASLKGAWFDTRVTVDGKYCDNEKEPQFTDDSAKILAGQGYALPFQFVVSSKCRSAKKTMLFTQFVNLVYEDTVSGRTYQQQVVAQTELPANELAKMNSVSIGPPKTKRTAK